MNAKKPSLKLVIFGLSFVLVGCATTDFTPYVGKQLQWPTSPGALAKTIDGVTVYQGLPPHSYILLGRLTALDASDRRLAWSAKSKGADAVIITDQMLMEGGVIYMPGNTTTYTSGSLVGKQYHATSSTYSTPGISIRMTSVATVAWLIKYKDSTQVRLENLDKLLEWLDRHPDGAPALASADGRPAAPAVTAEQVVEARERAIAERQSLLNSLTNSVRAAP